MECGEWNDEDWSTLIYTIRRKNCILMLGPDAAVEKADGQSRFLTEILANELAEKITSKVALWNENRSNLVQIAQYYCMETGKNTLEEKFYSFYDSRRRMTSQVHKDLASLPFYLAITSSPDHMLYEALKQGRKKPVIGRYNFRGDNMDIVPAGTVEAPLIFYLYGTIEEPESLVLTENDLLDFIVAVASGTPPLPRNILSELRSKNKSLLFLGFGFRHWYLRILLHVLNAGGKESRSFALEELAPRNIENFQRTILFFKESDYKIQICKKELNSFVKELRTRFEESSAAGSSPSETARILTSEDVPTVFICHAGEDKHYAAQLYDQLRTEGLNPWIDKENLRGGDEWRHLIAKTIKTVDYVLVLQSNALARKQIGYVNKEIHAALDRQDECRRGIRFIIPVQIEDCPLLEDLEHLQSINLSVKDDIRELITAIKRDLQRRKKR